MEIDFILKTDNINNSNMKYKYAYFDCTALTKVMQTTSKTKMAESKHHMNRSLKEYAKLVESADKKKEKRSNKFWHFGIPAIFNFRSFVFYMYNFIDNIFDFYNQFYVMSCINIQYNCIIPYALY